MHGSLKWPVQAASASYGKYCGHWQGVQCGCTGPAGSQDPDFSAHTADQKHLSLLTSDITLQLM